MLTNNTTLNGGAMTTTSMGGTHQQQQQHQLVMHETAVAHKYNEERWKDRGEPKPQ
jgi:hypothetical protein